LKACRLAILVPARIRYAKKAPEKDDQSAAIRGINCAGRLALLLDNDDLLFADHVEL